MRKIIVLTVLLVLSMAGVYAEPVMDLDGEDWVEWSWEVKLSFVRGYMMSDYFVLGMLMSNGYLKPGDDAAYRLGLTLPDTTDIKIMRDIDKFYAQTEKLDEPIGFAVFHTQEQKKTGQGRNVRQ